MKIPLLIVFYTSPLPPLITLRRLKELGFDIRLDHELTNVIKEAQLTGSKEPIRRLLENEIDRLDARIETADYALTQIYSLVSTTLIIVPLMVFSISLFTAPRLILPSSIFFSAVSALLGVASSTRLIPREMREENPPPIYYAPLTLSLFSLLSWDLGILVATLISAVFFYRFILLKQMRQQEGEGLFNRIMNYAFNPSFALRESGVKLSDLASRRFPEFYRLIFSTVSLLIVFGGGIEDFKRLEEYVSRFQRLKRRLRIKVSTMLVFSLISMGILGFGLGFILYFNKIFSNAGFMGSFLLYTVDPIEIKASLTAFSLALSLVTASVMHGNPLYFPIYLAFFNVVGLLFFNATPLLARSFLGV
ncbi:MAG: hypothetical protein J7L38_02315 [Thermoproteales archaeon]|nr:hypothetical protein [Thermoproteales archaeon]